MTSPEANVEAEYSEIHDEIYYLKLYDDRPRPRDSQSGSHYTGLKGRRAEDPDRTRHHHGKSQRRSRRAADNRKDECYSPPWWAWFLMALGIGVVGAIVAVAVVFTSNSTSIPEAPSSHSTSEAPLSQRCRVDVAILLDRYSTNHADWHHRLTFISSLMESLRTRNRTTRIALAVLSKNPDLSGIIYKFNDNQDMTVINLELWKIIAYAGRSAPYIPSGYLYVRSNIFNQAAGDRVNAQNVLIPIIQRNPPSLIDQQLQIEVTQMHLAAEVIPIGITDHVDDQTLAFLASEPKSFFHVGNDSMLSDITNRVITAVCEKSQS